jgi:hypothetical protein
VKALGGVDWKIQVADRHLEARVYVRMVLVAEFTEEEEDILNV